MSLLNTQQSKLLDKYSGAVPRYTSYPTAAQFTSTIAEPLYRCWLEQLPKKSNFSIYIHIPFCRKLCWFCGCSTTITRQNKPVEEYVQSLIKEITLVTQSIHTEGKVTHLHFGGGSPNIVEHQDLTNIMNAVNNSFSMSQSIERAMEIDSRDFSQKDANSLAANEINRVSMGVQDFNPEVQRAINRIQTYEQTASILTYLRNAGIDQINLDLMYGLPLQTVERVLHSIDLAHSLAPNRLALFGYGHCPWMKTHQKLLEKSPLPSAQERFDQYQAAVERLSSLGYVQIGIDHFARSDDPMATALNTKKIHRNFQGYTTDHAPSLIGFGSSSIGYSAKGFVQNISHPRKYQKVLNYDTLPVYRGIELSEDDRIRAAVITELMCYFSVDLKKVCNEFAKTCGYFSKEKEGLQELEKEGLVTVTGDYISIPSNYRYFTRIVCAQFDRYYQTDRKERHSRL